MDVVNTTPYAVHSLDTSPAPSLPGLTLVVKGAFALHNGLPAEAKEEPDFKGDETYLDDLGRSLSWATDLAPFKPRGELLVTAVCHAPDGRPRTGMEVGVALGPIQKTLLVSGDRAWAPGAQGALAIGRVQPFESMPIRWERAFGGLSYAQNPLGRGIDAEPDDAGGSTRWLPNVEYADKRVADAKDRPPPAGFGPVSPMWAPRLARQGTQDARWAAFRAPLPPKDFDPRFHNAAPDDQQLPEGYFLGDEPLTLIGLHRDVGVYKTALPGKLLRVFLLMREGIGDGGFVEVPMKLDTVHVDVEEEELTLVWRSPVKVKGNAEAEIEAIYVAEEELSAEPLPADAHRAELARLRPPKESRAEAAERDAAAGVAEAKKVLVKGGADPKLIAELDEMKNPADMFNRVVRYAEEKVRELEALAGKLKGPPAG